MVQALGSCPNNNYVSFNDDRGANLDPVEEINHFIVHHANAPRRNRPANAPRLGCAMNAVSIANIKGAGPRGFRPPGMKAGMRGPFGFRLITRRAPIRPACLAGN
jgi:hypothetical protein